MKKKLFAIGISIIFLLATSTSILSESTNDTEKLTIATSDILIVDEGDGDYNCIQCAINHANPNDIIKVYSGTYDEHIIIDKEVKLIGIPNEFENGSDAGNPVIDGNNCGDVVVINSSCVDVICFEIINSALDYRMGSGIIVNGDACNISSNIFENNFVGLNVQSDNIMVSHNIFYYNVFGINAGPNRLNTYRDNQLFNTGFSLQSEPNDLKTNVFDNNSVNGKPVYIHIWENDTTISHNDAGQVIIVDCHNVTIENIKISNATIGIAIGYSSDLIIRNNTLTNINRGGISLHADNSDVYNNSFVNCSYGCYLEGGDDFYIHHNNFIKCYKHDQPAISWVKKHQSFMDSTNVVYDSNYWGDWIGLKLPSMKCLPKIIPGFLTYAHKKLNIFPIFNFDWHPVQKPYLFNNDATTIYVDANGGADYTKIQDAIDNASDSDTVFVYNGTYYENLVVNKKIGLIGENKHITIIDGMMKGDTVAINVEGVTLSNFTITHGSTDIKNDLARAGIRITKSNSNIKNNIIKDNMLGIFGLRVTNLTICNNQFYDDGITFSPYENEARPKIFMEYFLHGIYNNTVNDKPLYYYKSQKDFTVPKDAGMIILTNCTNVTISNVNLTYSDNGLLMAYSSNCLIEHSNVSNSDGIWIFCSSQNIFQFNNLSNNFHGITLDYHSNENIVTNNIIYDNQMAGVMVEYYSINNHITKNDLINNTYSGYFTQAFRNKWDQNYYSDWIGLKHPKLSFLPKLILGRSLDLHLKSICYKIDWHPAETPYN